MKAACVMTDQLGGKALVIFVRSGNTARHAAWLRQEKATIYAFIDDAILYHQITLNWGTDPFLIQFDDDEPSNTVGAALEVMKQSGRIKTARDNCSRDRSHAKEQNSCYRLDERSGIIFCLNLSISIL